MFVDNYAHMFPESPSRLLSNLIKFFRFLPLSPSKRVKNFVKIFRFFGVQLESITFQFGLFWVNLGYKKYQKCPKICKKSVP